VRNWRKAFASCCSVAFVTVVASCGSDAPKIEETLSVRGAWARAADSGASTAVYFVLANEGSASDTLTGVASGDAEVTQMHISTRHGSMMHMSEVTALPVPADDSVQFRPLGAHVMLLRVRKPLEEGDSVDVTLSFVSGRTLPVRAGVRRP